MSSVVSDLTVPYPMNKPAMPAFRVHITRSAEWVANKQWHMARAVGTAVMKAFSEHPAQTHETYFQHLWFTIKTCLRFLVLSVILFLHGVFPFLFTKTASKQVEKIYLIMRARIPEARREVIKAEYEI